jgi:DNA-directed RNA polymerase specialized sigma24 family protein
MSTFEPDRLSQISTNWTEIFAAHSTALGSSRAAHHALVQRYCGAVYKYLLGATGDVHAAEDLSQTFALRFVRGDFHRADPVKGRFRDFVKTTLYNLVVDHFRARKRNHQSLPDEDLLPDPESMVDSSNAAFLRHWRQEILDRTWMELRQAGGASFFEVLRWKASNPEGRSIDGAGELTNLLQREMTPAGFRQTLHRAREQFAELLVREVAESIGHTDAGSVAEELAELELIDYCRPALNRFLTANG